MPRYNLTKNSEISINVDENDILQIKSGTVRIKSAAHAEDEASFVFRGHLSSIDFSEPKTLLVSAQSHSAVVDLIKGL